MLFKKTIEQGFTLFLKTDCSVEQPAPNFGCPSRRFACLLAYVQRPKASLFGIPVGNQLCYTL